MFSINKHIPHLKANYKGEIYGARQRIDTGIQHHKHKKIAYILSFIIICNASFCQSKVQAKKGVLDLRNWNWTTNGITDLNGEWEFYWKSLYTPSSFDSAKIKPSIYSKVPGFWNSLIPGIGLFDPGFWLCHLQVENIMSTIK